MTIIFLIIAFLISLSVHEMAHAYIGDKLGDPTARLMGRVTLNPLAHLDPVGTLLPIMLLIIGSPVVFGWGKPVRFDPYNLRNPKRDAAIISFAGPAANLLMAILFAIIIRVGLLTGALSPIVESLLVPFVVLNVTWGLFNLIPIHPLDGGKVLTGLLPDEPAREVDEFLSRYGTIILLFLILPIFSSTSPLFIVLLPIVRAILSVLLPGVNLV